MMKVCFKCFVEKPLSDFYVNIKLSGGHFNKCKECTKRDALLHREQNLEKVREYDRNRPNKEERCKKTIEYSQTEKGKAVRQKSSIKYKTQYPIKYKAKNAVNNAIRDGLLIKPNTCECCNNVFTSHNIHGHHIDYAKPLEVIWLCNLCHVEWHLNSEPLNGDEGL